MPRTGKIENLIKPGTHVHGKHSWYYPNPLLRYHKVCRWCSIVYSSRRPSGICAGPEKSEGKNTRATEELHDWYQPCWLDTPVTVCRSCNALLDSHLGSRPCPGVVQIVSGILADSYTGDKPHIGDLARVIGSRKILRWNGRMWILN